MKKDELGMPQLEQYADSEFMAYVLAHLIGEKGYMSEYIFNRIEKILKDMQKQEMI